MWDKKVIAHEHISQIGQGIPSHQEHHHLHQNLYATLSPSENMCRNSDLCECLGVIGRPQAAAASSCSPVPQSRCNYHNDSRHCPAFPVNQLCCWRLQCLGKTSRKRPLEGSWPNMRLRSATGTRLAGGLGACQLRKPGLRHKISLQNLCRDGFCGIVETKSQMQSVSSCVCLKSFKMCLKTKGLW